MSTRSCKESKFRSQNKIRARPGTAAQISDEQHGRCYSCKQILWVSRLILDQLTVAKLQKKDEEKFNALNTKTLTHFEFVRVTATICFLILLEPVIVIGCVQEQCLKADNQSLQINMILHRAKWEHYSGLML